MVVVPPPAHRRMHEAAPRPCGQDPRVPGTSESRSPPRLEPAFEATTGKDDVAPTDAACEWQLLQVHRDPAFARVEEPRDLGQPEDDVVGPEVAVRRGL